MKNQRGALWAFLSIFDIPDIVYPERTYLRRLRIIQTPFFGVYLHFIYLPDVSDPHDHPWNFLSIVLNGEYLEEVHVSHQNIIRSWKRWSIHKMSCYSTHRILLVNENTITLVFTGRRKRQWGFQTKNGWVSWHEYIPSEV